ncbi:MAG: hypothetical protein R2755_29070 [Acidimicrobiales bacterium]
MISAAAHGVQPLDTVFTDVTDPDGLRRDCRESAAIGYRQDLHPPEPDRHHQRGVHPLRR